MYGSIGGKNQGSNAAGVAVVAGVFDSAVCQQLGHNSISTFMWSTDPKFRMLGWHVTAWPPAQGRHAIEQMAQGAS